MRVFALVLMMAAVVAAAPNEDNSTSALINEALDRNVSLQLDGVLPDVLKTIENKTGVRIEVKDPAYDLLPWGEQTNIKATIENQTLRAALTAITQKLALNWELGQYEVWLKPRPALVRLGRRATVAELQTLDVLASTPFAGHEESMSVNDLIKAIDQQLASMKAQSIAIDLRPGDSADPQAGFIQLDKPVAIPRDATLSGALEDLTHQTNATWYPWGKDIVIVPKQQQIRLQLDKTITTRRFNGTDIGQVLDKLSESSGVPFQIEPGAFQRVPPEYRNIKLDLENATVRRILDDIRGVTGLDYVVKPDGIYVWNQNPNPTSTGRGGSADPTVAILELDGGVQLLLRESQVPADVQAYIKHKTQEEVDRLRRRMKDEGFVPTTQPATQPVQANNAKDL